MNLNKIYNFDNLEGISDIYTAVCGGEVFDGNDCVSNPCDCGFKAIRKNFTLTSRISEKNKVFMRHDELLNTSGENLHINHFAYRFSFVGSEYDVYSQLNHWQNESQGKWQELVTEISASSKGLYTTGNATPMAAIWDRQTKRGVVFHILPQYSWKISISRKNAVSDKVFTVVEISIYDDSLDLLVSPEASIDFSPVIYYEFYDRVSLDCHKLHAFFNEIYPRKTMPVMYNTWLGFFDRVSFDKVSAQIQKAADIGCEYFVLDAGWFGDGDADWKNLIGNWNENLTGAYMGKMAKLSQLVHNANMKFGIWIEPERALEGVQITKDHPEYFFKSNRSYFLDFSNEDARKYITNLTLELIRKYNVDYIKFDFNDNFIFDTKHTAFYNYRRGYEKYITDIKTEFPQLYLECCAGGGFRMDLDKLRIFDSFWFSDNQNPYESVEILKNSLLRIPPSAIDRWVSVTSVNDFINSYGTDEGTRCIATGDAIWDFVVGTKPEFICGFFRGGSPALSCDLEKLDDKLIKIFKSFIADYKNEREFWSGASCRILCDSQNYLALQYVNGDEIKIIVFTHKVTQSSIRIYPCIENADYMVDNKLFRNDELCENGIIIDEPKSRFSYTVCLKKVENEM